MLQEKNSTSISNLEYLELVMSLDFPYSEYSNDELEKSYKLLQNKTYKKTSNIGLDIIHQYYKSIWRCNVNRYKSPLDAWNDPETMLKVINNRLKYKNCALNALDIRAGLTIAKIAPKISVFKPAYAKYLIEKYLPDFDTIFDPCAGFGGRMLGACALNKKYIGQDINSTTVKESNNLISNMQLNAEVCVKNSLYDTGEYDCLFTCPPYFSNYKPKEVWHQSLEPQYCTDDWVEILLKNYKCKKYLFVVDKTEKYNNAIVEEVQNKSHFGVNTEKVLLIERK